MKKTKYLAGALAVSIMLMGAGYAAWTQNFVVSNTVNTGSMDFQLNAYAEPASHRVSDPEAQIYLDSEKYTTMNVSVDQNSYAIKVDTTKLYPGSKRPYVVTITNTGTMPIKLGDLENTFIDANKNPITDQTPLKLTYEVWPPTPDSPARPEGIVAFKEYLKTKQIGVTKGVNDTLSFRVTQELPITAENSLENQNFTYSLNFKYVQFNEVK
jgi:hypothetical protein